VSDAIQQVVATRGGNSGNIGELAQNRTLTRAERRILESICDVSQRDLQVDERCKRIGVSRTRYFQIMSDAWFRSQHREYIRRSVQERVSALVGASYDTAVTPGRDGFNDRRMLLEVTGHYVPRQQIDHTTAGQPIVGVVGVDPSQL
jgi:hypothetical protein